jgi:VWFA-related protein
MKPPAKLLFLAAAIAMAQEPSVGPSFRAGVQLVQVSVVVRDKQAKPVADLRREEFQIFDNGLPREIRLFVAESEKVDASPPILRAPGMFTNRIASSAASYSGYSVILLDNLFTDFLVTNPDDGEEGGGFGVQMALRTLRSIAAGDRIAIYAVESQKLEVICEFTSDRDLLESRMRKWKASVDTPKLSEAILTGDASDPFAAMNAKATEQAVADSVRQGALRRASVNDDELNLIADHLAGVPGRKNLIWLSNRFVMSPLALAKFNSAGVAIYPVDLDGVCVCPAGSPCNTCPTRPTSLMDGIATQTGGVAYYARNDLDVAIRQAMDDGRVSDTLGFYQSADRRTSQVHRIAVHVSRPDVTLRYRSSYETEAARPAGTNPVADLLQALQRPIDATQVPIKASVKRAQDRLDLQATVNLESLALTPDKGRWKGNVEIAARFTAADESVVGKVLSQTLNLNLGQDTYEKAVHDGGLGYHNVFKLPAKAVELKFLFANPASGKIGTLTIPLSAVAAGEAHAK